MKSTNPRIIEEYRKLSETFTVDGLRLQRSTLNCLIGQIGALGTTRQIALTSPNCPIGEFIVEANAYRTEARTCPMKFKKIRVL